MSAALIRVQNLLSLTVSHIALNPAISGSLLWILTRAPPNIRQHLFNRFAALRDPPSLAKVVKVLKGLLVLGLLGTVNRQFNKIALNAWRLKSEKKRWNLNQEIAVVTGGCSGIGELIVKGLFKKGVKVAVLDIQPLPASLQGCSSIQHFECDVTDPAAVRSTADSIRSKMGAPSILINNAGIAHAHTILDTSDEYLRKIFDVNLLSNWYTVKAFLPDMITKNKGHIITIASTASYAGVGGMVDYTATKAGVLAFHEGLNQELKLHLHAPKVLTTSIHPHWVRTPLIQSWEKGLHASNSPINEPQVVADAVIKQIVSASGGQVFLPSTVGTAALLRALPNWVQETMRAQASSVVLNGMKA